jgi:hypothetical protein
MINELKVFYAGEKGLMTFNNKKTVFQHREEREGVKEGLGIIIENSLFDKGNYAFAIFKNVETVIPQDYNTLGFFHNKGVPLKIEKGLYGDNVLLKETYKDRTYIRAYKEDGSIGLYESEVIKNANYEGPNVYFKRLDDLVKNWEDITDSVLSDIISSIPKLSCVADMDDEAVLSALKTLSHNKIFILESGAIVAQGKFESLIIWTENTEVKMAWLGRMLDISKLSCKDVTSDLMAILGAN